MGVRFAQQTRERARSTGAGELSLDQIRALRRIRSARGTHTPAQLTEMDAEIRELDRLRLLEDYGKLARRIEPTLGKLRGNPAKRLSHDEKVHLEAWLGTIESLRRSYNDQFHIAMLLDTAGDCDETIREVNLAHLYLAVLTNPGEYVRQGYLKHSGPEVRPALADRITGLRTGASLAQLLAEAALPSRLRSLPEETAPRAVAAAEFLQLVELEVVELAFDPAYAATPERMNLGPTHRELFDHRDAGGYLLEAVANLGRKLDEHLQHKPVNQ